jgi:hypothetical protein
VRAVLPRALPAVLLASLAVTGPVAAEVLWRFDTGG